MARRTSARLAKKGKKANAGVDDVHDDLGHDPSFEDSDSEEEEQRPPPPKRQRVAAKPAKAVARKKHVRGKQGGLAGLVTMPIDIFTEVASHLLPGDIISLARSNKFFRDLLMHRSAIHIWRGAMKNVEGLPPCPPAMSEPHYLALLFSKTCSACGALVRVNMDPFLLVRLCGSCRNTRLVPLDTVPVLLMPWILYSTNIMPRKRRSAYAYVLREEASDLLAQYEEQKHLKDKALIDAWIQERQETYDARREQAVVLSRFINSLEQNRERELVDAKAARRSEIQRRLADMGWTEKDMEFGWWSSQQRTWYELVSRPQPLTDRVWTNLRPKLIPLLETNREERLNMERETRRIGRQRRLAELFLKIKAKDPSAVELKAPNPVPRVSSTMPTVSFTYRGPFPDLAHTLKWPVVNNLYETDSTVEEMEAKFEARRDEIEGLVAEWRNQIHTYLANQLRDGYQSQGKVLRPTISVLNDNSDALANISDDLKLLLRADSLFHKPATTDLSIQPLSYGTIISAERLVGQPSVYSSVVPRAAPTLDHIHWYPEAHEAARELLADMGRPDASYLEMKGVGNVFVCGRCHETQVRSWEGMVQHYLEQKQLHAKIQEDETLAAEDITYNDVHDPALFTDLPMITDYVTKTVGTTFDIGLSRLQICKVCEGIPAAKAVIASKSAILKHLLDVHEIANPVVDEDYAPRGLPVIDSGLYGMDYDSDDSYDMHYGCDCAYHMMLDDYDDFDDDGIDPGDMYGYGGYDEDEDEDYWW